MGKMWAGFLPENNNQHYGGAVWACHILLLIGAVTVLTGLLRTLLPDSGLVSLVGLSLAHGDGLTMIVLAAWTGATQIVWGAVMILVARRYRPFTAPVLGLVLVERVLMGLSVFVLKPINSGPVPPEIYLIMAIAAMAIVALAMMALAAPQRD